MSDTTEGVAEQVAQFFAGRCMAYHKDRDKAWRCLKPENHNGDCDAPSSGHTPDDGCDTDRGTVGGRLVDVLCEHGRSLTSCAMCRPIEYPEESRINVYVCQTCGGYTVTIDVDEGVTPFMIGCRASGEERECKGVAHSSFYPKGPRPPHIPEPAWEWYRMTDAEARRQEKKYPGSWHHHEQGGLWIRKRAVSSDTD